MFRNLLELTAELATLSKADLELRQLLNLFIENDFLGLQSLLAYRTMVTNERGDMSMKAPKIIADIDFWLTVYEKMMAVSQ